MVYYYEPAFEKQKEFDKYLQQLGDLHEKEMTLLEEIHQQTMDTISEIFGTHILTVGSLFMSIETLTDALMADAPLNDIGVAVGLVFAAIASISGAYSIDAWRKRSQNNKVIAEKNKTLDAVRKAYEATDRHLDTIIHGY